MQNPPSPMLPKRSGLNGIVQTMTVTNSKQPRANQPTGLPRKEEQKAAAAAAKMLSGLELQPGKIIVDLFIDFNDCKQFAQVTQ